MLISEWHLSHFLPTLLCYYCHTNYTFVEPKSINELFKELLNTVVFYARKKLQKCPYNVLSLLVPLIPLCTLELLSSVFSYQPKLFFVCLFLRQASWWHILFSVFVCLKMSKFLLHFRKTDFLDKELLIDSLFFSIWTCHSISL